MFDKKTFLMVLLMAIFPLIHAQNGNSPVIRFDVDTADFGVVQEGDTIIYDFYFTNIGTSDLVIKQAWPACGCTHPTYTKEPVKPGARGVIHVEFHSAGFGGKEVVKEVIILSNAPENYARFKAKIMKKSTVKREYKPYQHSAKPKTKPYRKKKK